MPNHALPADATIGDRLRRIRTERGMTQESLAHTAGLSVDVVKKLEGGTRTTARLTTLTRLADALGVPLSQLTDRRPRLNGQGERLVLDLRDVILSPDVLPGVDPREDDGTPTAMDELWRLVRQGWRDYWHGDFLGMARAMPRLIGEARVTERATGAAAAGVLAQAYQLTSLLLVHLGREDLGAMAAERAITAALAGDDELQHATLHGTYAYVLLNQGRNGEAERVAVSAAARVEPRYSTAAPEHLAVWGRLMLYATTGAAEDGRAGTALDHISMAQAGAARLGHDQRAYGDSFGPTRVAKNRTGLYVVLDEPGKALAVARDVRREDLYPIGYGSHLLDVAQAQLDTHRHAAAVASLTTARDLSPMWFRHHPVARLLVTGLAERQARISPALRELLGSLEAR